MNFPIKWLTYKQRIQADVREALNQHGADDFFDRSFVEAIAGQVKQQEEWFLKLFALQAAVIAFLIVGFVSPDAKSSLFGLELKSIQGIREVLLAVSSTAAVFMAALACSRDAALHVASAVAKETLPSELRHFGLFTSPTMLNVRVYIPREYDRWQFGLWHGTAFTIVAALLVVTMFCIVIAASLAVHWALILDIWQHPSLGRWSTVALIYVFSTYTFNLVLVLRMALPFPYVDKGALKTGR
jgi:hypothetical protein